MQPKGLAASVLCLLLSLLCCAQVLRAMDDYYNEINANVHRSVHHLSAQATTAYETARQKVRASPRVTVLFASAKAAKHNYMRGYCLAQATQ